MSYAICPACGVDVHLKDSTQVGQNVVCPRCQELLAVITLDPIMLELYKISVNNDWTNAEKQEAAKRHERKYKNRHEGDATDERDENWNRPLRKSRSRSRMDW